MDPNWKGMVTGPGPPAGRDHDGGVELVDQQGSLAWVLHFGSGQQRALHPSLVGAEVGTAGGVGSAGCTGWRPVAQQAAPLSHPSDQAQVDQRIGLPRTGSMPVGFLVLLVEGLFQVADGAGVQGALGKGQGQLEGLAGIAQVGFAQDSDLAGSEALFLE